MSLRAVLLTAMVGASPTMGLPLLAMQFAPQALAITDSDNGNGNGVFEPNEAVYLTPTWRNVGPAPVTLGGRTGSFTGPPGAWYQHVTFTAFYGTIPPGGQASCPQWSCYNLGLQVGARPVTHWDATISEAVGSGSPPPTVKDWTLHIGESFTDVPPANPYYRFVETILHHGVTSGCAADTYCPAAPVTREQMAVFVLVSKEGPGYAPPPCGATPLFADVPASSPFCRWIEELARRGVVDGCGGGNYCPASSASREQMAVIVLRTLDPVLVPPDCVPPNIYDDVPETSPFCRWIEELTLRGVAAGCGGGNYCPAAEVTREQMSVFLAATFGLVLYGV
jgi:hypothetical protein